MSQLKEIDEEEEEQTPPPPWVPWHQFVTNNISYENNEVFLE